MHTDVAVCVRNDTRSEHYIDDTRPRNHMTLQHSERIRRPPSRHGDLFVQGTEVAYLAEGASVGRYRLFYYAHILAIVRHLTCDLDL